jgi:NADH-ubiquinone oxidoreductase chain 6
MLINVRISELLSNTSNSIPLAIFISILFSYPVYKILPYSIIVFNTYIPKLNNIYDYFFGNIIKMNSLNLDNGQMYLVTSKV